ncbi:hypothetical protein IQ07DRAFT_594943 [Pyrenochaeta sp. DS3sAY3a]|nr:hypothetical protein IQ07DRAFT_594943 [Pyrenochaeta sp. DS3sAY3a]
MSAQEVIPNSPYSDDPESDFCYWVTILFRDKNNKDTKQILGPYIKKFDDLCLFESHFEKCYDEENVRNQLSKKFRKWGVNFFDKRTPKVINTRGERTITIHAEENPDIVRILKRLRDDAPTFVFVMRVRKIQNRKWPYMKAKQEISNTAAETEYEVVETYDSLGAASIGASVAVKKNKRYDDQYRPFWWDDGKICCMTTDSNGHCKRVAIITMMQLTTEKRKVKAIPDDSIDFDKVVAVAKGREEYLANIRKLMKLANGNGLESNWE